MQSTKKTLGTVKNHYYAVFVMFKPDFLNVTCRTIMAGRLNHTKNTAKLQRYNTLKLLKSNRLEVISNRPDIALIEYNEQTCLIIDIAEKNEEDTKFKKTDIY